MTGLKAYIGSIISLTNEVWEQIAVCGEKLAVDKTGIFIHKGSRFKKEIFVQEGTIRAFITDSDGNEKTTAFFQKNDFVSTNSLRTHKGHSLYSYQALSPASLIMIDTDKFAVLLSQFSTLNQLVKVVKEKETDRLSNRDDCLLQVRAEEKYAKFRQYYPHLESEISHHYIASYLGITPVSFSRIRKKAGIIESH